MNRKEFTDLVSGSQEAFRRFLAALCCGDKALADDIAQDTYLKAYLACDSLRDPSTFGAWLRRIAYNTFISSRRSLRPECAIDDALHLAGGEAADEGFRYQDLYAALARLGERERTAILLFYMEGYAIREIATITESAENAVKQQLSRGRAHLKDLL